MSFQKLILFAMMLTALPASATTWYIRPDGGTKTQCTGSVNAPYPGSGSAQACAFNHPYWMIASNGVSWTSFVGGDTIQFVSTSGHSDTYFTGEQNAGVGVDWNANGLSSICAPPNPGQANGAACIMPAPPSGTAVAHTKILGQSVGSCHDPAHTHLVNPTILSGIAGAFSILDLRGTNYVDISCIAVTQPDTCTTVGNGTGMCGNLSNFVHFGGMVLNYLTGPGASNLTVTDFAAAGIGSQGILGSSLNVLGGGAQVTSFTDTYVVGNGGAGWSGDGGGCNTSCESVGTLNLSHNIYAWNGCVAVNYDFTKSYQLNTYNFCMAQQQGNFANGDGFVQIAAGNLTLNVDHSDFSNNTQDGFDALHLVDDLTTSPVINISTSIAAHNMGQTFKIGAGAASTAINNIAVGDCRALTVDANYPLNPAGWSSGNTIPGDACRASGGNWVFSLKAGTQITLQNNTTIGYATTTYGAGCITGTTCITGTPHAVGIFQNNVTYALPDPGNGGQFASGWFLPNGNPFAQTGGAASFNNWFQMRTGCPDAALSDTNFLCGDPGFLAASVNANGTVVTVNPNITTSSLVYHAGTTIAGITTDFNGTARPPFSMGAFEPLGTPTAATPTASPVAGTYSTTQTVTLSTTTSGATICYTINGTTPGAAVAGTCDFGTSTYTGSISVATTTTIKTLATKAGDTNSSVASFLYTIVPIVSTPTAFPVAGTYASTQTVGISTVTSGATICATTDGSTPTASPAGTCTNGTSGPFTVSTTTTIKAIGTKSGDTDSAVATFLYTITVSPPTGLTIRANFKGVIVK